MDIKNFTSAIAQIAEEKGIPYEKVIETIETAIAAAYKKDYGQKGQIIKAKLNPDTGETRFWQVKLVVDSPMLLSEEEIQKIQERRELSSKEEEEEGEGDGKKIRFNPEKHVMVAEAEDIKSGIKPGEELEIPLKTKGDYGRIAAQTAKQVILQKIREAEKEAVLNEYKSKEGEIVSGIVQRVEGRNIYLDLGKWQGVLPREEQVRGEFYRPGQRLRVYVVKVEITPKGPVVFLSRAYPKLVSKLFELEVPEIAAGSVVIRSIAREAGSRSKIAVESTQEGVDPIGSAVGQRGTRVMAVINELGGEKVDIIEYSEASDKYIANALSPAKILEVRIQPRNKALAIVPDDQLSLAIGKEGQNVRLAAKLTGWKIDVKTAQQADERVEEESLEGEKEQEQKEEKKEETEEKVKKARKKKDDKVAKISKKSSETLSIGGAKDKTPVKKKTKNNKTK